MVNIIDKLNMRIANFAKYFTFFLTFVVVYGVFVRYFLHRPDVRVHFISYWLLGLTFLLAGGYCLYTGSHISVDILYQRLPSRVKRWVKMLDLFAILSFCLIMLPTAVTLSWKSTLINERDSSLVIFSPPVWWYKWFVVVGLVLLALQTISLILDTVKTKGDTPKEVID